MKIFWLGKKAKELTKDIYLLLEGNRDFQFRDQIQRAAISIMNNIAKGSCREVRSMLILAKGLSYIEGTVCEKLILETGQVSRMLSNFIKTLNK